MGGEHKWNDAPFKVVLVLVGAGGGRVDVTAKLSGLGFFQLCLPG